MSLLLQTLKPDRLGHETGSSPHHAATPLPDGLALEPRSDKTEPRVEPEITSPLASGTRTAPEPESAFIATGSGSRLWLLLGGSLLAAGIGGGFVWQQNRTTPSAAAVIPSMKANAHVASSAQSTIPRAASQPTMQVLRPKAKQAPYRPATMRRPHALPQQTAETEIPHHLENAWNAFQQGDLTTAEKHYRLIYSRDPYNRDTLLGLAAIALRKNRQSEALDHYRHLLTLDPQDRDARSGLLLINPDGEHETLPPHGKSSPPAPSVLAQRNAANQRWPEAQEQYFQAYSQEPENSDLAYNLAISLDHMRQSELAALYYRKALTGRGGQFDRLAAQKRLAEIMAGEK